MKSIVDFSTLLSHSMSEIMFIRSERNSSSSAGSDKGESEDDEDSPAEEDTAADRDELEAIYCAHKISSLVSSGKVRYKDIAILMRSPKN